MEDLVTARDQAHRMTEAELLLGITQALELAGWTWMHILRSDGVTQGDAGFPDVIAVHPARPDVLALELKAERGQVTYEQLAWQAMHGRYVDARIVRPDDYDATLDLILGR